jgi:anti-anti-sigma regulatory factor
VTAAREPDDPARPEAAGRPIVVDVTGLPRGGPGGAAAAVAALARLRLAARRTGHRVRLTGATPALLALLDQSGLVGEFEWEPEDREEVRGVQE